MTVTLNLTPEIEAGLLARAHGNGMTVEEYLLSMVEGVVNPATSATGKSEQRAAAYEKWSARHRRNTPPLSDFAVSREAMYQDRDGQ